MAAQGVQLIPSPEDIMQILKRTGAFREGHFVYPTGKHTAHYLQTPLAFRYYDTVRVLGAHIIGWGSVVRFQSAPAEIDGVTIKSLVEFDEKFYESSDECPECKKGVPEEHVRF